MLSLNYFKVAMILTKKCTKCLPLSLSIWPSRGKLGLVLSMVMMSTVGAVAL